MFLNFLNSPSAILVEGAHTVSSPTGLFLSGYTIYSISRESSRVAEILGHYCIRFWIVTNLALSTDPLCSSREAHSCSNVVQIPVAREMPMATL